MGENAFIKENAERTELAWVAFSAVAAFSVV
jgi:hypothetical protein